MTTEEVMDAIVRACMRFSVRKAFLYGSRAKGTHLEKSDIAIAISGICDMDGFLDAIDEIETLYTIDVLNLDSCKNQSLLEDIRLYGKKIYEAV